MKSPAETLAPAFPIAPSRDQARTALEIWLLQAAVFGRDTWWPILRDVLVLSDFRDEINFAFWRAMLLHDADLPLCGRLLREELSRRDWERWVNRFCGGFDITRDPDVDRIVGLLRGEDEEAIVDFARNEWLLDEAPRR